MAFSVVISVGLLLLFTVVELGNAKPLGLVNGTVEERDEYHNLTKRVVCQWSDIDVLYTVYVGTGRGAYAGTNGDVQIGFRGDSGTDCRGPPNYSYLYNLDDPKKDDFERVQTSGFIVEGSRVSETNTVSGFRLSHSGDEWCFFDLTIIVKYTPPGGEEELHAFRYEHDDWFTGIRDFPIYKIY